MTAAAADDAGEQATPVPPLRDDLVLQEGPETPEGAPTWTIHDPVRNAYFHVGRDALEMLARWHLGSEEAIARAVTRETPFTVGPEDVSALGRFLVQGNLVHVRGQEGWAMTRNQLAAARPPWLRWLLTHYLFIRIPLVRPTRFLNAVGPLAAPLFSRGFIALIVAAAVLGGYLVVRQWESFITTFSAFATLPGIITAALALTLTKIVHELGHGLTAHRYGCRVPTMGVALLVLWPVLYTDATDAWRLPNPWHRLHIAAAGIIWEVGLAAFALLLWGFLPPGPARSAVFIVATTAWVTTLLVNLNPFMRFDGYYLLADLWDVPNLQPRAFALARWWLRRVLLGFDEAPPEAFNPRRRRGMIVYAICTWVYRLVLFLTIALVVYHFAFKLLGIFLMIVELAFFIGRPIKNELNVWWQMRGRMTWNRHTVGSLVGLGLLLGLVFTPWHGWVNAPALLEAHNHSRIHPPAAGRVAAVEAGHGDTVEKGDVLVRLEAPELRNRLRKVERRQAMTRLQLDRLTGSQDNLESRLVLQEKLTRLKTEAAGLRRRLDNLVLRAPFDGRVRDVDPALRKGLWVESDRRLMMVVAPGPPRITAYVPEADVKAIAPGAEATFYPNAPARPSITTTVRKVEALGRQTLEIPYLVSPLGGPIAARREDKQGGQQGARGKSKPAFRPRNAVFRVTVDVPPDTPPPPRVDRGRLRIEAPARSLAGRAWRTVAGVIIRESGF